MLVLKTFEQIPSGTQFVMPAYQRGYRWGEDQVVKLLDDISIALKEDKNKPYYLQPVVLKKREDKVYEVIDGQQRLTTIWLILNYALRMLSTLGNEYVPPGYSLHYDTRVSDDFLTKIDIRNAGDLVPTTIDEEYMQRAFLCIDSFFPKNDPMKRLTTVSEITSYIKESVTLIWYEDENTDNSDSYQLFLNLNHGRIPLGNSELIKAYLLTRIAKIYQEDQLKDREIEITEKWDEMEQVLWNDHDRFWAFLGGPMDEGSKGRPRLEYFLSILYPVKEGEEEREYSSFYDFVENFDNIPDNRLKCDWQQSFWHEQIYNKFLILKEWFEDSELYHKIGYLVAIKPNQVERTKFLQTLLKERYEAKDKKDFREKLERYIRASMADVNLEELTYTHYDKVRKVLLLYGILVDIKESKKNPEAERYSFSIHHNTDWSIEHINPQSDSRLSGKENLTKQDMKTWLEMQKPYLEETSLYEDPVFKNDTSLLSEIEDVLADDAQMLTREKFRDLRIRITKCGIDDESLNNIRNLALLPCGVNSMLSNSVYKVKRQKIIEYLRQGKFIPLCTRWIFLGVYFDSVIERELGNVYFPQSASKNYFESMQDTLKDYLPKNEIVEE